jgi:signal transduction histidine kinase
MEPQDEFGIYLIYFLPMVLACLISTGIAYLAWRRKEMRGSVAFALFMFDIALWSANTGFLEISQTPEMALFWYKLRYLSIATTPTLLFVFALQYTGRVQRLNFLALLGLFFIPILTQIIIWTDPQLFVREVEFGANGSLMMIVKDVSGPWFVVHFVYAFISILAGIILVLIIGMQSALIFRWQAFALVLGGLPVFFISAILATFANKSVALFTPLGFLFMGLVYSWTLFRMRLFDLNSISRSYLFDHMGEGVVLLDVSGRIMDINQAGAKLFNQPIKQLINQNVSGIIRLPDDGSTIGQTAYEVQAMIETGERTLAVKASPVQPEMISGGGKLLLLEDITEQKNSQLALRQVYEITAIANEYQQLDQMLNRILEISLSVTHGLAGFIHLMDESEQNLRLAACVGLPPDSLVPGAFGEAWLRAAGGDQPVVWEGAEKDMKVEPAGRWVAIGLPVKNKGRKLGTLCILFKSPWVVSDETEHLLAAIADHVGIAVESTRLLEQVGKSAVMLERQRLARELHDSVTQSLFGAVLLAKAGIHSINQADYTEARHALSRVDEVAQQALKEMRLLIYELRPLDLQTTGLHDAISQRLATVENRVDIQTGLEYDAQVEIGGETAVGLYRIVQEALNNVLKHAHATRVSVAVTADREWIRLRVEDNGVGFDMDGAAKKGGLGIAGMRERTDNLRGQLSIDSQPGGGTRLLVECPTPPGAVLLDPL